jgi:hypothetical protein
LKDARARLEPFVKAAQARGDIDPSLSPEAVVRVMIAQYQGLITQRLVEPDLSLAGYADVLKALYGGTFWRGESPKQNGHTAASPASALSH